MSGISACKHIWTPMKRRSQQPDGVFRVCPKTEFAHFRPQRGRFKTAWMFVQNLLDEHWKREWIAFFLVPLVRGPAFLARGVIERHFKRLNRVNFPVPLKHKSGVFSFALFDFRAYLFSPLVDLANLCAPFDYLFFRSFFHRSSRAHDENYTAHPDTTTVTH